MTQWFIDSFSTREIAVMLWVVVALVYVVRNAQVRKSFSLLFKQLFKKYFIIIFIIFGVYVASQIYFLQRLGFWNNLLIKDLIIWVFTFGLVSIVNINSLSKELHFVKSIMRDTLKLIVVVEFIVNFYTFPIYIELFFVPLTIIIYGMLAYSEVDNKYKPVQNFLNAILTVIGFGLIVYLIRTLILDYESLLSQSNLALFLLPIYLSITFIPFLYIFALYIVYEELIVVMRHVLKDKELGDYFTKKLIRECRLSLKKLTTFNKNKRVKIIGCKSIVDLNEVFSSK